MKYVRKPNRPPIAASKKGAPARSEAEGRRGCRGKAPMGGGACGRRGRSGAAPSAGRGGAAAGSPGQGGDLPSTAVAERRTRRPGAERPRARVPRRGEPAGLGRSAHGGRGGKNTPPEGRPLTGEAGGEKRKG